jgi:hypothetical protein
LAQFLGWRRNFCSSTTTIPPTAKQMADLELVCLKVYPRVLVCPYEEAQFSGQKLRNFFLAQFLGWRRNFCSSTTTIYSIANEI